MLPTTCHTQLQAVQQDIADVKEELHQVKQDLAKARANKDGPEVEFLRKRVESLDKQLSSLRDKDNILLRNQLGGQYCCHQWLAKKVVLLSSVGACHVDARSTSFCCPESSLASASITFIAQPISFTDPMASGSVIICTITPCLCHAGKLCRHS